MSGGAPRRGRGVAFAAITGAILLGTVASVDPGAQAAPDPIDQAKVRLAQLDEQTSNCLLYTSPSPRDVEESRMPSSA